MNLSKITLIRIFSYSILLIAVIFFIILFNSKRPNSSPSPIMSGILVALFVVIVSRRQYEGVGMRASDGAIIASVLTVPIFLGSLALLIDIPIFNHVDPILLTSCYLNVYVGLCFGAISTVYFTGKQLAFLEKNNEIKPIDMARLEMLMIVGGIIFLLISCGYVFFDLLSYAANLILFVISALLTGSLMRLVRIRFWENINGKIVMITNKRIYVKYKNLQ